MKITVKTTQQKVFQVRVFQVSTFLHRSLLVGRHRGLGVRRRPQARDPQVSRSSCRGPEDHLLWSVPVLSLLSVLLIRAQARSCPMTSQ